jgi:hypothetical protein
MRLRRIILFDYRFLGRRSAIDEVRGRGEVRRKATLVGRRRAQELVTKKFAIVGR